MKLTKVIGINGLPLSEVKHRSRLYVLSDRSSSVRIKSVQMKTRNYRTCIVSLFPEDLDRLVSYYDEKKISTEDIKRNRFYCLRNQLR